MQKELVIVKNFGDSLIDESKIDYIRLNFEVLPYETKFFLEDPETYVCAIKSELENDDIDKHFPFWLKQNGLDFGKIEIGKEDTGILYLALKTEDINFGIVDSFIYLLESDKFKFKFKPEAGSI